MNRRSFCTTAWAPGSYGINIPSEYIYDEDFFPKDGKTVTLRLVARGQTRIVTGVNYDKRSFYDGCPHLIKKEICQWLHDIGAAPWPYGKPPKFRMTLVEPHVFEVSPI